MNISKEELPIMAKAYDLASSSLIVIDQSMKVVCINLHAQKILRIKKASTWLGKSFLELWAQAKLPALLDKNLNLICPKVMNIHEHYRVWTKVRVKIAQKTHWFLIDKDVSEVSDTYDSLKSEIEKITGHVFEHNLPVNQYVEEIHHFLTSMINRIPCYVYWKNKDLEYIGCNEMAAEFFNLNSPEDIIGKTDFDLFADKMLAESYRDTDREIINGGKTMLKLPQVLVQKNGEVFYTLVSKVPITSEAGTVVGVLGITIDITKEKQAEIAKTDFIANMSHDIRTPLTGVIGLSEILENALVDPLHKEEAHLLYESGNQLLNMLNEILDDVQAGNSNQLDLQEETFDLRQCLDNLIKLEAPTVTAKNLSLSSKIEPEVPFYIVSDRKKLHHILLNLLGNAIKFTQKGGITLELRLIKAEGTEATIRFTVSDTGIGIPKDQQDKVFDRFFRANPSYKGMYKGYGLGLHIVQSYVSLLGGEISLKSEEGVGTAISFDLLCKIGRKEDLPVQSKAVIEKVHSAKTQTGLHFLLVEDNVIALKVLESMLEHQGHHFSSAQSGEEALELVKLNHYDLVITDLGLPSMSGTELAEHIRHWELSYQKAAVPIVGLTGHSPESARAQCLQAGMNEVFRKPINADNLQLMIDDYAHPNKAKSAVIAQSESVSVKELLPELDSFTLFEPEEGIKYTNDLSLLRSVLQTYLSPAVQDDFHKMTEAYHQKNWQQVERQAHRIKAGVSCLGTVRLQKACIYVEYYYKAEQELLLEKHYHQLIQINNETLMVVSDWLA